MKSFALDFAFVTIRFKATRKWPSLQKGRPACTACNVLHGWSKEQENEQRNNKNNAASSCQASVKIELLKGVGILPQNGTS